jgi:hypothetical protein
MVIPPSLESLSIDKQKINGNYRSFTQESLVHHIHAFSVAESKEGLLTGKILIISLFKYYWTWNLLNLFN